MRKALKGIALTLAGCGSLAAPAVAAPTLTNDARELHDQVRNRVRLEVGDEGPSRENIRTALRRDPDFDRLLETFCRESLASAPSRDLAEDATQETLMKIWKGRPDIFLKDHDEVLRYVKSSTRRNAYTGFAQRRPTSSEGAARAIGTTPDPAEAAVARDLLDELERRLDADEREVLKSRLAGHTSERQIAKARGTTRYGTARAVDGLERKLHALLREREPTPEL